MSVSADAMTVARNEGFRDRIRYHLTTAAIAVMAEPADTANHAARVQYASAVLDGTADYASAAIAVLTNPTLAAAIDMEVADFALADADLPFVINTVFGALAGVSL